FWICWPFGKANTSVQPFVMAAPVFLMSMLAPKPLPPTQVGAVYVMLQLCANAPGADPSAARAAANNQRNERDIEVSPGSTIYQWLAWIRGEMRCAERARVMRHVRSVHRKSHSMESRQSRVATTTAVKRGPPVKRGPSYPRRQRCLYVNTVVSGFGRFVPRAW